MIDSPTADAWARSQAQDARDRAIRNEGAIEGLKELHREHQKWAGDMEDRRRKEHEALWKKIDTIEQERQTAHGALHDRLDRLAAAMNRVQIGVLVTAVLLLLGIIGFLLVEGPPWK